jgi:tetratricopeptide (TPR) repeat protein
MAKKLILVLFLALVIFSVIYALRDKREFTTSSEKAYQAFQAGETLRKKLYYREAIPEFEKAVKIDTNFAIAYSRLAELYNDFDEAEKAKAY